VTGELRQVGANVELWTGEFWVEAAKNSTLFLYMCGGFNLTDSEIFAQAKIKNPDDPAGFLQEQLKIAFPNMHKAFPELFL